jgi:hypothetical protein
MHPLVFSVLRVVAHFTAAHRFAENDSSISCQIASLPLRSLT